MLYTVPAAVPRQKKKSKIEIYSPQRSCRPFWVPTLQIRKVTPCPHGQRTVRKIFTPPRNLNLDNGPIIEGVLQGPERVCTLGRNWGKMSWPPIQVGDDFQTSWGLSRQRNFAKRLAGRVGWWHKMNATKRASGDRRGGKKEDGVVKIEPLVERFFSVPTNISLRRDGLLVTGSVTFLAEI